MYLLLIVVLIFRASFVRHFPGVEAAKISSPQPNNAGNITRIVGGHPIGIAAAPWQVAIIYDGYFECGGSVISRSLVMTAAHCVDGTKTSKFKIRAGSRLFKRGGQVRRVSRIFVNKLYNKNTHNHDVAIFKLSKKLTINKYVKPVRLASRYQPPSKYATVTGWGTISEHSDNPSSNLRAVSVDFIKLKKCKKDYKSGANIKITANMVCAGVPSGGKDACQGDSGGPLVHNGVQYGIVTFGIGCARAKYPGVYTSVSAEKEWIRKVMAEI